MKYIYLLLAACFVFAGCDKTENSAEPSSVTFLPTITVEGPMSVELACNATGYADPGASAEEGGQSIELNTSINAKYFGSDAIDGPDGYEIVYSAENQDGIPGAEVRTVFWPECNGDLVNSIAGTYTAYLTRLNSDGVPLATPQYQGVGPIIIKDLGNDQYQISDAIGGWYEYGRSLGVAYAALGQTVTAVDIPANDFTFGPPIEVSSFGGELIMTEFMVDAANKEINFVTEWAFGFTFQVKLIQN